jgi:putative pyruvate formate lyase activating enzyme
MPKVARIAPHMWEEPCISGTNGSGAVFFSGCTLRCVFCQNYEISAKNNGTYISVSKLAQEFKALEDSGVHNINLVTPTPYVNAIIEALSIYKPNIPVVYNCSGYEDLNTIKKLEGYVDIYLPDFKYSQNTLAEKYSSAKNYVEIATNAIKEMVRQTGSAEFDHNGIMQKGTIIRHLVLPNHTKNSIGVLDIIKENFSDCMVSLMGQYTPLGKAKEFEKLNRKITQREYNKVKDYLFDLDIDGFVQELSSAGEKYVPVWDYDGSR